MAALDSIDTIVVLMMENRSFDHVLGHLRHPKYGNRQEVDGLDDPGSTTAYDNFYDNQVYKPFASRDASFPHDLPHELASIHTQLDFVDDQATMAGFVKSYVEATHSVVVKPPPMAFLKPDAVPISSFLASEYTIANYWYSPLPSGTQPNRAVAFSGTSYINDNVTGLIPHGELVFDWLTRRQVRWRVYHSGLSFFILFGIDEVLGPNFRSIRRLGQDIVREPAATAPQVIFIEPAYGDSPVHFGFTPNDNHPPLAMGPGEAFVESVYACLTKDPAKWARTLFVVTYDEHGGFYDHSEPAQVRMTPHADAKFTTPFTTTGVRVPAFIVSPWVDRGAACDAMLDHTSILQLLAEKFGGGRRSYSTAVNERIDGGIESLSSVLQRSHARTEIPQAKTKPILATSVIERTAQRPRSTHQKAFAASARKCLSEHSDAAMAQFPELAMLPPEDE